MDSACARVAAGRRPVGVSLPGLGGTAGAEGKRGRGRGDEAGAGARTLSKAELWRQRGASLDRTGGEKWRWLYPTRVRLTVAAAAAAAAND